MPLPQMNDEVEEETALDKVAVVCRPDNAEANAAAANGTRGGLQETLLQQPAEHGVLETLEDRRGRRYSHLILYITSFNVSLGFSIVLTGVWPYLRQLDPGVSKDMLGWVIAANPIGQMIASPLLGFWSNWSGSNRSAFIATMTLFSVGNFLYAILSVFGSGALAVMIVSRIIVGASSGNMALIRTYISASTTVKERTTAVSLTSAAQAIGFIIGPAIQTALAIAFTEEAEGATNSTGVAAVEELLEEVAENTGIQWNMYTLTGWISCFLGLINLFLFLPCLFKEYNIAAKEAQFQKRAANAETTKVPKPDYPPLFGVMFVFFISIMIYVLLETLMVPMCMDLYAWSDEKAIKVVGTGLSIAAVICSLTFILLGFISKVVDERVVLCVGVFAMVAGMIVFIPMGSTYPKIKNCTSIHSLTNDFNETLSIGDPVHLVISDNEVSDALQGSSGNRSGVQDLPLPSNASKASPVLTESEVHAHTPPETEAASMAVRRRRRRHVTMEGDCEDTGCPPEQKWCYYTPIIELAQLGVGSFFAIIGYPITFTISSAMYSKILGPEPQGLWMGLLISLGSLSRATGPIVVSYIYTELGTKWTFGILTCVMFSIVIVTASLYKRMVPMNIFR